MHMHWCVAFFVFCRWLAFTLKVVSSHPWCIRPSRTLERPTWITRSQGKTCDRAQDTHSDRHGDQMNGKAKKRNNDECLVLSHQWRASNCSSVPTAGRCTRRDLKDNPKGCKNDDALRMVTLLRRAQADMFGGSVRTRLPLDSVCGCRPRDLPLGVSHVAVLTATLDKKEVLGCPCNLCARTVTT